MRSMMDWVSCAFSLRANSIKTQGAPASLKAAQTPADVRAAFAEGLIDSVEAEALE